MIATPDQETGWTEADCLDITELEPLIPGLTERGRGYLAQYRCTERLLQRDRMSYYDPFSDDFLEGVMRYIVQF